MDTNYEELFGLTPEDMMAGEEEQELADPVDDQEDLGEEEQEIADPDVDDEGEEEPEEEGGEDDQDDQQPKSKPQTQEERRAQAAARRQREQQDAIDAAVAAERQKNQKAWDDHYKAMNLRDPYHGNKPVTTQAEYEAYVAARDQQTLERDLKSGKVTPERYQADVQRAAQAAAQQQMMAQQARSAAEAEVNRQLAELQKAEPGVKGIDELMADPTFVAAFRATRDMTKAYRMAHVDEIEARAKGAAMAKQAGDGKAHLHRQSTRGGGAPMVTRETLEMYRKFVPNAKIEDIRKNEAEYQRSRKK